MSAPKLRVVPDPRYWTDAQVAARLNMSVNYFSTHKAQLYRAGMPQPDELFGGKTDAKALEAWCDRRAGLIDAIGRSSEPDPFAERIEGRRHGHA